MFARIVVDSCYGSVMISYRHSVSNIFLAVLLYDVAPYPILLSWKNYPLSRALYELPCELSKGMILEFAAP